MATSIKISNAHLNGPELLKRLRGVESPGKKKLVNAIKTGDWRLVFEELAYRVELYTKAKVINYNRADLATIAYSISSYGPAKIADSLMTKNGLNIPVAPAIQQRFEQKIAQQVKVQQKPVQVRKQQKVTGDVDQLELLNNYVEVLNKLESNEGYITNLRLDAFHNKNVMNNKANSAQYVIGELARLFVQIESAIRTTGKPTEFCIKRVHANFRTVSLTVSRMDLMDLVSLFDVVNIPSQILTSKNPKNKIMSGLQNNSDLVYAFVEYCTNNSVYVENDQKLLNDLTDIFFSASEFQRYNKNLEDYQALQNAIEGSFVFPINTITGDDLVPLFNIVMGYDFGEHAEADAFAFYNVSNEPEPEDEDENDSPTLDEIQTYLNAKSIDIDYFHEFADVVQDHIDNELTVHESINQALEEYPELVTIPYFLLLTYFDENIKQFEYSVGYAVNDDEDDEEDPETYCENLVESMEDEIDSYGLDIALELGTIDDGIMNVTFTGTKESMLELIQKASKNNQSTFDIDSLNEAIENIVE